MKNIGYVMASRMLVENRKPVRFMYREKGEGNDSGWRFFSGEEDQEYVDNSDNIKIYDIQTILDIDKSISPYLDSAEYCAFEKAEDEKCFRMVEDFEFGENLEEA